MYAFRRLKWSLPPVALGADKWWHHNGTTIEFLCGMVCGIT